MTIGDRIKRVRRANKMSLKTFGSELGVADRTVMNWEKNNSGVPFEMAIQICQKFGCTLNWLAGIKEESQEKQIPKASINKTKANDTASRAYENCFIIACPTCGGRLKLKSKGQYCDKCGQKLDWGGNEK